MRSAEQINKLYNAFVNSMGATAKNHINQVSRGYNGTNNFIILNEMTHIKTVFDESWTYLTEAEKNQICDIAATYINN